MTTPEHRQSRSHVVRVLAAAMAFDEPTVTKSLTRARETAEHLYDVMAEQGIIGGAGSGNANGAAQQGGADDALPLFANATDAAPA